MSSKNIDTQYNNYINYDSIAPLLIYQMSKKITRKLDSLINSCIMKISGGNLKKATVFSSSLNQDVYLIEKRISNRLSLKNKEITDFLIEHSIQSKYVYKHTWNDNDIVMWDNRCTMHSVEPFNNNTIKRIMHRVTLVGDQEPIMA